MIHGGFYLDGSVNTVCAVAGTFYPVASGMTALSSMTAGALVFQNNSEIKVIKPGLYHIGISVAIQEPDHAGQWLGISLMLDGAAVDGGKMYHYNDQVVKVVSMSTSYILSLANNAVVKLGVTNKSGPNHNVTVEQVVFTMLSIDR